MRSILPVKQLKGRVRVWNSDGVESFGKNAVVFTGADILTKLLSGNPQYKISAFYFEYVNTSGSVSEPAVSRSDTAATRQAVASPHDLLRSILSATPTLSSSNGSDYQNNQSTFFSATSTTTGVINSLPFSAGANSKVYSVSLVATPLFSDLTQDVLYSRFLLGSVVPVTGSGSISASWQLECD